MLAGGQRGRLPRLLTKVRSELQSFLVDLASHAVVADQAVDQQLRLGCFGLAVVVGEHKPEVRAIFLWDVAADAETLCPTDLVGDVVIVSLEPM